MRKILFLFFIFLTVTTIFSQPNYHIEEEKLFIKIDTTKNSISAIDIVKVKILDDTNFLKFKINGNLYVSNVEDENGYTLRYLQDDTENFELTVKFNSPLKKGDEKTLKVTYEGCFAKVKFDFFKEIGKKYFSYIGDDRILLYSGSYWFLESPNFFEKSKYSMQITLPTGFTPITSLKLTDTINLGLSKTYVYKTENEIYPPSFIAGRFLKKNLNTSGIDISIFYEENFKNLDKFIDLLKNYITFLNQNYGFLPDEPLKIVIVNDKVFNHFGMKNIVILPENLIKNYTRKENLYNLLLKITYQKWFYIPKKIEPEMLWLIEGISGYSLIDFLNKKFGSDYVKDLMTILAVKSLKHLNEIKTSSAYLTGLNSDKYDSVVVSKSLWIISMFKYLVGNDKFKKFLLSLDENLRGNPLNENSLNEVLKNNFNDNFPWFFNIWVKSTKLPEFKFEYIIFRLTKGGFQTEGEIKCNFENFKMPIEILFKNKGKDEIKKINLIGKRTKFRIETETEPLKLVLDPENKILKRTPQLEVKLHFIIGDELFSEGKYLDAIEEYKKVFDTFPYSSLANYKIALTFYKLKNYDSALDSFRLAVDGDGNPGWVIAMSNLYMGMIYDTLGQRERAIAQYKKVLNGNDNSHGAVDLAMKYLKSPYKPEKNEKNN